MILVSRPIIDAELILLGVSSGLEVFNMDDLFGMLDDIKRMDKRQFFYQVLSFGKNFYRFLPG